MKKIFSLRVLFSLASIICFNASIGMALEVERRYQYYYVTPIRAEDLVTEMRLKGPYNPYSEKLRFNASYQPKIQFNKSVVLPQDKGACNVNYGDLQLIGTITLPKLSASQRYSTELLDYFKSELAELHAHELEHEAIYQTGLTRLEADIDTLLDTLEYEECISVNDEVKTLINQAMAQLEEDNLRFDCEEYGIERGFAACDHFKESVAVNQGVLRGYSDLKHSISQSNDSYAKRSSRVTSVNQETKVKECKGEVIEPFKDHFYCVEQTS